MGATIIARCVHGVEWICADEVAQRVPGVRELSLARREVTFQLPAADPALADLRTVDDVFLQVGQIDGVGTGRSEPPAVARQLARLDWRSPVAVVRQFRDLPSTPRFDVVASIEGRRSYNRYAVQDAVGAALAPVLAGRYLPRTPTAGPGIEPDLTVRVFLRGPLAIAAVRLAARPLHRRDYKQDTGAGTLHPSLAAALVRLAAPPPGGVLLDPFAGDGTIPIEAALAYPGLRVIAADLDPTRLRNTRRNAERAAAEIVVLRADAAAPPLRPGRVTTVVANPPWNVAVEARGQLAGALDRFWRGLPRVTASGARVCLLSDAALEVPEALRRTGYRVSLAVRLRLAGRISHLILCAPPGADLPELPAGPAAWRQRAIAAGVVTDEGF